MVGAEGSAEVGTERAGGGGGGGDEARALNGEVNRDDAERAESVGDTQLPS